MNLTFKFAARALSCGPLRFLFLLASLGLATPLRADTSWTGGTANWSPGFWSNGIPNGLNITALINNRGDALVPVGISGTYGLLILGNTSGQAGSVQLTGGILTGTQTTSGYNAGSTGAITITSGTWNSSQEFMFGYSGHGTLTMSDGLMAGDGYFGYQRNGTGTGLISGGTWNAAHFIGVASSGSAVLNVAGGVINTDEMEVGSSANGIGSLNVSSGTVNVTFSATSQINIGLGGTGNMALSGGEVSTPSVFLGYNRGSKGVANITGGQLTTSNILLIGYLGTGSMTLSGGDVTGPFSYVFHGKATMTGGTWEDSQETDVGSTFGATLEVKGGVMQPGVMVIGRGTGSALVSGGTVAGGTFFVGSDGTGSLTISGGSVSASGGVGLGYSASGTQHATDSGVLNLNGNSLGRGVLETPLIVKGAGKGAINFNGGVLRATEDQTDFLSGFLPGNVKINTGGAYFDANGYQVTVLAPLSGAGGVHVQGSGVFTLAGANTFSGGVFIDQTFVHVGQGSGLGMSTNALQLTNGGSLDLNNFSVTVGDLNGSADAIMGNTGTGSVVLTTAGKGNSDYEGMLVDGSGLVGLRKAGLGTLTLAGANSYSGGTVLSAGTLNLASDTAIGTGLFTMQGVSTIDNTSGSALALSTNNNQAWNANFTFKGSQALDLGTGAVLMNASRSIVVNSSTLTVGGAISGATAATGLTKSGTGTLVLAGNNTYTGPTIISAGTLQLGSNGAGGSLGNGTVTNNGILLFQAGDLTMANVIGGTGKLVKADGNFLTLSGANTYTGGTMIENGMLVIGNAKALGATTGDLAVQGGLDLSGYSVTVGALSGTGVIESTGGSGKLTTNTSKSTTFAGILSFIPLTLEKAGSGTLTLSGANFNTGGITLSGGGLNLGDAAALGNGTFTISGVTTLDNTTGASLMLTSNNAQAWNANFTFKGSSDLNLGSGNVLLSATRTVNVAANTLFVDGSILGATPTAGLIKTGTGTLTLRGTSSYGGSTTVSAGVLDLEGGTLGSGAIINSGTFILNHVSDLTMANTISGAGLFVKRGAGGVLTLAGANTYTGGTRLEGGGIKLGNAKALGATTGDLAMGDATLDLNGFSTTVGLLSGTAGSITNTATGLAKLTSNSSKSGTYAGGFFDGSGIALVAFEKAGSGVLTLSGSSTFSGGTTLSGGGLNLANASALGTGSVTFSGVTTLDNTSGGALALAGNNAQNWNANFTFKGSNELDLGTGNVSMSASRTVTVTSSTLTVGGVISGATASTGLTKSGTGTLVLTGSNLYGGATTISQGVLQLGNGGASGSLGMGAIANSGTFVTDRSDDFALAGAINGKGRFVKNGTGALTLYGTNTYTGGTFLNEGKLVMGNDKALGTGGDLTMGNATLDLNSRAVTIGLLTGSGTITNSTGIGKLTTSSAKSGTYSGEITETSGNSLVFEKGGTGTLTLTGSNGFSGGFRLSGGGLNIGNAFALGTNTFTIGGVSTLDNTTGAALTLGTYLSQFWNADFTFKGSNDLDLGPGAVIMNATRTVNVASHALTVDAIYGSTAGLTKTGTGTLILKGANAYNGTTTIGAGILQLGNGGTTGSLSGGAIKNSGTFVVNRSDDTSLPNLISGAGKLVKEGAGALTLNGANTYTGGTVLNTGKITLGNAKALGATTGSLMLNSGTLEMNGFSATVGLLTGGATSGINNVSGTSVKLTTNSSASGTFAGSLLSSQLTLEKAGTGTLTLSGSNAHLGGTILSGGGLNLANADALGAGAFTISGVTTLDNTIGTALTLATNNAQNWNANFTFKGSNDLDLGTGDVVMNATHTVNVVSNTLTVGGVISGATVATGLTKSGTGTLLLTNNNTYTGVTTVSAGVLQLGNDGSSGSIANSSLVNSGTVTIRRSDAVSYGGVISGRGVMRLEGSGTVTLTGNNTYSGGTVLKAGQLLVGSAKALGTGNLTLDGGTLATDGTQHQINVGGNLVWSSTARIALTLSLDATGDVLNIAGAVSAPDGDPLTFVLNVQSGDGQYLIMTAARGFGVLTASDFAFVLAPSSPTASGYFSITGKNLYFVNNTDGQNGNTVLSVGLPQETILAKDAVTPDFASESSGNLSVGAVPEPSTWALLGLGGLLLTAWHLRSRLA